jgi:hypothetical protein
MLEKITPKPQDPRKIASAIVKAIKELDRVCFEAYSQNYTAAPRKELFDQLTRLGYSMTDKYRLESV